jgi:hypothetical protein
MLRLVQVAGWLIGVGAIGAAWYYGQPVLERHATMTRTTRPQVVLRNVPVWMSDLVVHELGTIVTAALDGNPFDQAALRQASRELEANAWVRQVTRISRQPGNRIDIDAVYREPAAVIEQRDPVQQTIIGFCLVDSKGVRLPAVYQREHLPKLDLPLVRGVLKAPPEPGRPWPGGDVQAGIALAQVIAVQPWRKQVQAIDVSNHGGRRHVAQAHLKLLTQLDDDDDPLNNPGVAWGRAPGEEQFYEPDTTTKLSNLTQLLRRYNTIDANGRVVDLFRDVVHIHAQDEPSDYTVSRE